MPLNRVRLSPSGKYIGDPPLRQGSGSEGVRWRLHGSGAGITCPPGTQTGIPGMTNATVDMRPDYIYQVKSYVELQISGLTVGPAQVQVYFRTRLVDGSVWSVWSPLSATWHEVPLTATPLAAQQGFFDSLSNITVSGPSDRIEIGVLGSGSNGTHVVLLPELAFADVSEYVG